MQTLTGFIQFVQRSNARRFRLRRVVEGACTILDLDDLQCFPAECSRERSDAYNILMNFQQHSRARVANLGEAQFSSTELRLCDDERLGIEFPFPKW